MGPGPYTPDPLGAAWPAPFPWFSFGFAGPVPGFGLEVLVPPANEPVSLDEAKTQCRVDNTAEDSLITGWIVAARRMTEQAIGLRVVSQTLKLSLPYWPTDGLIRLGVGPVTAVNVVRYFAPTTGTATVLTANTDYRTWLAYRPPVVYPAPGTYWPAGQYGRIPAVEVEYAAGMPTTDPDYELARAAVMMLVTHWYENRGDEEAPNRLGTPQGWRRIVQGMDGRGYL